jgi:hypothetical protein
MSLVAHIIKGAKQQVAGCFAPLNLYFQPFNNYNYKLNQSLITYKPVGMIIAFVL